MKIESEINLTGNEDDFEKIAMLADNLIEKLSKNKLKKEDRELLESAVSIIYELRVNLLR
jgi:cell division protein ZapA (FtsZ GTPase activity inhibitor)